MADSIFLGDQLSFFDDWIHSSICDDWLDFPYFTSMVSCEQFSEGIAVRGLYSILTHYDFLCKQFLSNATQASITFLFNSDPWTTLEIIQRNIIFPKIYMYMDYVLSLENTLENNTLQIKVIMMLCYIFGTILFFLILWLPYVIRLRTEIWRTDSMLTLIPTDEIVGNRFLKDVFERKCELISQT